MEKSNSEQLFNRALMAEQGGKPEIAEKYLRLACKRDAEERGLQQAA